MMYSSKPHKSQKTQKNYVKFPVKICLKSGVGGMSSCDTEDTYLRGTKHLQTPDTLFVR